MTEPKLTDEEMGATIALFLRLKKDKDGRFKTTWGTKTYLGLYLSIKSLLEEGGHLCQS